MSRQTFMVVHPDGTWQTRTTTTGRVYTGAIVKVERVADVIETWQDSLQYRLDSGRGYGTDEAFVGWYQENIKKYQDMLDQGVRHMYGKAEYRSDIEAARSEARRRTLGDHGTKVEGRRQWDVYIAHPVPEGTKNSKYADIAKSVAEQWAVPF